MTAPATSRDEVPVFVPVGEADCFALLTLPVTPANGLTVVLLWGAGPYPSSGRNQLRTRLARKLAGAGFHALRMDYQGIGESSGVAPPVRFDRPEAQDVRAVCRWLRDQGHDRVVLVSYCFGTRKALAVADGIDGLQGVALISGPVLDEDRQQTKTRGRSLRWYARQALAPATLRRFMTNPRRRRKYLRWLRARLRRAVTPAPRARQGDRTAGTAVLDPIRRLVARQVPVLLAYGTADDFYPDFVETRSGALGTLVEQAGGLVTVRVIEAPHELQSSVQLQVDLIEVVEEWLSGLTRPARR